MPSGNTSYHTKLYDVPVTLSTKYWLSRFSDKRGRQSPHPHSFASIVCDISTAKVVTSRICVLLVIDVYASQLTSLFGLLRVFLGFCSKRNALMIRQHRVKCASYVAIFTFSPCLWTRLACEGGVGLNNIAGFVLHVCYVLVNNMSAMVLLGLFNSLFVCG